MNNTDKSTLNKSDFENTKLSLPLKIFVWFFFGCFSAVLLGVIFNRAVYNYSTFLLCTVLALTVFIIFSCYLLMIKYQKNCNAYYKTILWVAALVLLILQLVFGKLLRFSPIFDLEAVYKEAINWAESGTFGSYHSDTCHYDYFYIFPNNLGVLSFLAVIFKVAKLLGVDYFTFATLINGLMATATMVLTSLICNRLFGYRGGLTAILLFLISPPFYLIAPVFYTDSLSLLFPVLSCYLMIISRNKKLSLQLLIVIAAILIIALGTLIKPTVSIIAIAIMILLAVKKNFKQLICYALVFISITAIVNAGFNSMVYSSHLDKAKAEQKNTPITYWLNLAFHSDGRYNNDIFALSQIEDPIERKEALSNELKSCLKEKNLLDYLSLFETKATIAFGDGTYALSDFLDDNPVKYGNLHKTVLYASENYYTYSTVCTGIFAAIMLLMLLSVKWKSNNFFIIFAQISVFGILLFLMMWEVNSRYITTFIPFIFICAVAGTENLETLISEKFKKN